MGGSLIGGAVVGGGVTVGEIVGDDSMAVVDIGADDGGTVVDDKSTLVGSGRPICMQLRGHYYSIVDKVRNGCSSS